MSLTAITRPIITSLYNRTGYDYQPSVNNRTFSSFKCGVRDTYKVSYTLQDYAAF